MNQFEDRRNNNSSSVFTSLLILVLGGAIGYFVALNGWLGLSDRPVIGDSIHADALDLDTFWEAYDTIQKTFYYQNDIDQQTLEYGAVKGMIDALGNDYTLFMDPDETTEFDAQLEGELEGIGAVLREEEGRIIVVETIPESPAERAGLKPEDIILEIDGELASKMNFFDAISSIRGTRGTTVVLNIYREKANEAFDVSIVREKIEIESVVREDLEDNLVYVALNTFNEHTAEEFSEVINSLILDKPKGLIIDLRFNGGGLLNESVDILSYLLDTNLTAVVLKDLNNEIPFYTEDKAKLLDVPIVVLVNEGSASAAEIVAGALQDYDRAIIMGEKTFGKGSVQEITYFNDQSSLRVTSAAWYTPKDRNIDGVGLEPDISVSITDEDIENQFDRQKEEAIKYLKRL
jgi:carboxyl-terminal processing protease